MALEKTEFPGYFRDSRTGVIINTNEADLISYRKQVAQEVSMHGLESKIKKLEDLVQVLLSKERGTDVQDH